MQTPKSAHTRPGGRQEREQEQADEVRRAHARGNDLKVQAGPDDVRHGVRQEDDQVKEEVAQVEIFANNLVCRAAVARYTTPRVADT
jgi:hypothetical protein